MVPVNIGVGRSLPAERKVRMNQLGFGCLPIYKEDLKSIKYVDSAEPSCGSRFKSLASVTRLGNLLDFGQLFKACGNN